MSRPRHRARQSEPAQRDDRQGADKIPFEGNLLDNAALVRLQAATESSKKIGNRATQIVRNDHKLKALAIKKNQIHVVGTPSIKFEGTPTFLDVEGLPDRDFYYLVGLRFESGGAHVERSFWADGLDGERIMWEKCLRDLKAIGNARRSSATVRTKRGFSDI